MGGGRKRACLLLLPGVPQWGQNFYLKKYIFDICTNDLKIYFEFSHQAFGELLLLNAISTFFAVQNI